MASILAREVPALGEAERRRVIGNTSGSAARAIAFGTLGLAKLEDAALAILRDGDPTNARRSELASDLGKKGSAERYAAFLDFVPAMIAREVRRLEGRQRERALDAYAKARQLSAIAPRVALDPAATVFEMGGLLAAIAQTPSLKR